MEHPESNILYVCPTCFQVCENEQGCHEHQKTTGHQMVICVPGKLGDERRKPVRDRFGRLVSRAPRWFLEAAGWIED